MRNIGEEKSSVTADTVYIASCVHDVDKDIYYVTLAGDFDYISNLLRVVKHRIRKFKRSAKMVR